MLLSSIRTSISFLRTRLPVLCFVLLFGACASTDDIGRIQYDINTLKADVKGLRKKSQTLQAQLPGQKDTFNKKVQALRGTQDATAQNISDMRIEVENLRSEFQGITGRFEETQHSNSTELAETKEMLMSRLHALELSVSDMKKKISEMESVDTKRIEAEKKRIEADKKLKHEREAAEKAKEAERKAREAAAEKARKEAESKLTVKDRYIAAYELFKQGKTAESREGFMALLEKDPESEYSDNARFWIGECYYKDKEYEDAILAYEELFRKNPDSDKVPGAMLKQGLAFYALKDKKTGDIILERLIKKYPDSEQARLAKKKMRKIVTPPKSR